MIARPASFPSTGAGFIMADIAASSRASNGLWAGKDIQPLEKEEIAKNCGLLPCQHIQALKNRKKIRAAADLQPDQIQPASLDLRLGRVAWRVRASFLPGKARRVDEQLRTLKLHEFSLENGAVLERGCVYVVELEESLDLPESLAAIANPKSSTGRLDVFTRLITDFSEVFDYVEGGYCGKLYAEISPRTFSIKVRKGSRLNQLRFRRRAGPQDRYHRPWLSDRDLKQLHKAAPFVEGDAIIRHGLNIRVNLLGAKRSSTMGYKALKYAGIVDIDRSSAYKIRDFWEPVKPGAGGRLILDPHEFYILASKERLHVAPDYAAEMVPIDPMRGEFRVHYAGFFDPGFGHTAAGSAGSRAVLEIRSHEVPFILEDGQIVARLVYEHLAERPNRLYGQDSGSNYQSQGLKLSKHFRQK